MITTSLERNQKENMYVLSYKSIGGAGDHLCTDKNG